MTEPDTMPANLTKAQEHILLHSLGLTYGTKMYRNHFVTGEGSVDHPDCMALVEMGMMRRQAGNQLTGGDDAFFVTDAGKQAALDAMPKLTRGQKRYRDWLNADSGETFIGWLKRKSCNHLMGGNQ